MKKVSIVALLVFVLAALYFSVWPVPVEPVAWDAPTDEGLTGPHSENDLLSSATSIDLGEFSGPEDVALGDDGFLYAATREGVILRISPSGRTVKPFANVGGMPLGIEVYVDGSLVVANAYSGIQRVSVTGDVMTLLSQVNGRPLEYANDVAIAADGRIFFSNASMKFSAKRSGGTLDASLLDILEHGGNGAVIEFDPVDGTARTLIDGLNFANGVAVSGDQQFLLVAETGSYRILKHWLAGPDVGTTEVLIDNLPGFPDNINNGLNGRFWIGLAAPRNALLDRLSDRPFVRKIVQRLPAVVRPKPIDASHVIAIDADGTVLMDLQDPAATYPLLTGVLETTKALYLTTLVGHRLPWVDKQNLR